MSKIRAIQVCGDYHRIRPLMGTLIDYRDADEFQKFRDKESERLIKTIHHRGKAQ